MAIEIDGESKMRTPTTFGIVPYALKVMVPEGFNEDTIDISPRIACG